MNAAHRLVEIRFEKSGLSKGRARLTAASRALLAAAAREIGRGGDLVSIIFCGLPEMRELHRVFMGDDTPTDVLSFPAGNAVGPPHLGDIAVCIPFAAVQARSLRRTLAQELALLLIHGLLHLAGHDHDVPASKRRMDAETRRLLRLPEARSLAELTLQCKAAR